jgi:hypothetical protein
MNEPKQPPNSFRITLNVSSMRPRLDALLLEALRQQDLNPLLKGISRKAFKDLFYEKRIQIKGQSALPSSAIATGTTYIDILGFE